MKIKTYPIENGKKTWKQLEHVVHYGYSGSTVFSDFVDLGLSSLLSLTDNLKYPDIVERVKQNKLTGIYEDQYMQIVGMYEQNKTQPRGKRPIDYMAEAFCCLFQETKELEHDILGEIFMNQISLGENGQFFTPVGICDMMTQISMGEQPVTNGMISDPCCGSGRFFISMGKLNKDAHFVGVDIAPICAKMTALNMWLFDLNADIYCGDSLLMKMERVWRIRKGGYIYEEKVESIPEPIRTQMKAQVQTLFDLNEVEKKIA